MSELEKLLNQNSDDNESKVDIHPRVLVRPLTWQKFGLLSSVLGVTRTILLERAIEEFVEKHQNELSKFSKKKS